MLTKQEMFDRAWNGLKAQGWKKAGYIDEDGVFVCQYLDDNGCRCAWGHVDPSLDEHLGGQLAVNGLRIRKIGLAGLLSSREVIFALDLQQAHDRADGLLTMQERLQAVATKYNLTVPA